MKCAGIDIGSRTIKVVVTENSNILEYRHADTGYDPLNQTKQLLDGLGYDRLLATGYGRNLVEIEYDSPTVTEIKAHAQGAKALFPTASLILDIGGQDCKVISLFDNGKVKKFEMNDRCAAGTGKFLEIMASTLGFNIQEFGDHALESQTEIQINSMCTVFAESEVISLISKGHERNDIAWALHKSVAKRAVSMINRIGGDGPIVFEGGVAKNPCIRVLLEKLLHREIIVPDLPQFAGALGASLLAQEARSEV